MDASEQPPTPKVAGVEYDIQGSSMMVTTWFEDRSFKLEFVTFPRDTNLSYAKVST